jgi:F-box and WD-40 domain protein 1/11
VSSVVTTNAATGAAARGRRAQELQLSTSVSDACAADLVAQLPPELALLILAQLSHADIQACLLVSHAWHARAMAGSVWRALFARRADAGWALRPDAEAVWARIADDAGDIDALASQLGASAGLDDHAGPSRRALHWHDLYRARHALARRWNLLPGAAGPSRSQLSSPPTPMTPSGAALSATALAHSLAFSSPQPGRVVHTSTQGEAIALPALQPVTRHLRGHTDYVYSVRSDLGLWTPRANVLAALRASRPRGFCRADGFETQDQAEERSAHRARLRGERYQGPGFARRQPFAAPASPGHADDVLRGLGTRGRIVSCSRDRTIRVWDGQTGACIYTLVGHTASAVCLAYDDELLVSGSSDMTALVWDFRVCASRARDDDGADWQPRQLAHLRGHSGAVLNVCLDERWILTCSRDTTIRVYERATLQLVRVYRNHAGPVNVGLLSRDAAGRSIVMSASGDGSMQLWDLARGECLRTFVGHERGVACLDFGGGVVVSGSNDNTVRVWDAASGRCCGISREHAQLVRAVVWEARRRVGVSAGYDRRIVCWSVAPQLLVGDADPPPELEPFMRLCESEGRVFDVQIDAQRLLSAGEDSMVYVTDFAHGEPLMRLFS